MKFTLSIHTDNASFQCPNGSLDEDTFTRDHEVARILEVAVAKLRENSYSAYHTNLRDLNGNTVGDFEYTSTRADYL